MKGNREIRRRQVLVLLCTSYYDQTRGIASLHPPRQDSEENIIAVVLRRCRYSKKKNLPKTTNNSGPIHHHIHWTKYSLLWQLVSCEVNVLLPIWPKLVSVSNLDCFVLKTVSAYVHIKTLMSSNTQRPLFLGFNVQIPFVATNTFLISVGSVAVQHSSPITVSLSLSGLAVSLCVFLLMRLFNSSSFLPPLQNLLSSELWSIWIKCAQWKCNFRPYIAHSVSFLARIIWYWYYK